MIYAADEEYDDDITSGLVDLLDEHDPRRLDRWAEQIDEDTRCRYDGTLGEDEP